MYDFNIEINFYNENNKTNTINIKNKLMTMENLLNAK